LFILSLMLSACGSEKKAIKSEPEKTAEPKKTISMAVLYFDNNSLTNVKELDPFKKGLTDSLITDLSVLESIQIVERTKLEHLLNELKLSSSGMVDENSAKKIGKILGVNYILLGSYVCIDKSLRVDARIINVSTGVITKSVSVNGLAENFFDLIDDLSHKIGDGLSLAIKKSEEQPHEKLDFKAVLLYSEGLDLMDKKDYSGAEDKFNMALKLSPDYKAASQKLCEINNMGTGLKNPEKN
ncbi:MAG: hypothetical protein HQK91_04585, partial [Nitrospirae bacterium]|nr:hypothetical protein [Nitrospirota bacterium]